jgi:hypothetical protein
MSDLKNIMQNAEITPPQEAWAFIAQTLDNQTQAQQTFATKMYTYEVAPPQDVWAAIENKLPTTQIKSTTKKQASIFAMPAFKYAAAACVAGILGIATYTFLNNSQQNIPANPAQPTVQNSVNVPAQPTTTSQQINNPVTTVATTNATAKTTIKNTAAIKSNPVSLPNTNTTGIAAVTNPLDGAVDPINNSTPTDINTTATNQYVNIVGPNGEAVRLSTKFSKQIGLFEGQAEEGIDVIIRESSIWRGKINQWRKAMLNANISPSFDNIFDFEALDKTFRKNK